MDYKPDPETLPIIEEELRELGLDKESILCIMEEVKEGNSFEIRGAIK